VSQKWLERCKPDLAEFDSEPVTCTTDSVRLSNSEVEGHSGEDESEGEIEEDIVIWRIVTGSVKRIYGKRKRGRRERERQKGWSQNPLIWRKVSMTTTRRGRSFSRLGCVVTT
jgi:hypothetical protein